MLLPKLRRPDSGASHRRAGTSRESRQLGSARIRREQKARLQPDAARERQL
jgi:hypothetical protein